MLIETDRVDCRIRPLDSCFSISIIVGGNSIYPASFCWQFSDLGAGIIDMDDFESGRTLDSRGCGWNRMDASFGADN